MNIHITGNFIFNTTFLTKHFTMKRRDFITSSTIATAGLGSVLVASCNSTDKPVKAEAASVDGIPDFELNEESIASLQEKIAAGKYSSEQITNLYLDRIDSIDKKDRC
jgi:amidase